VEGPVHFKRYNAKFRAVSVLKIQKKKIKLIITEQEKGWFMEFAGIITSKLAYTF